MSDRGGDEKVCPFCAETIKAAAIRCRYCQADLVVDPSQSVAEEARPQGWQLWKRIGSSKNPQDEDSAPEPVPGDEVDLPFHAGQKLLAILIGATLGMLVITGVLVATKARPPAIPTDGKDAAPVQLTSETARDAGLVAATKLTQKALSYKWNTLERDITGAEAGMTPGFRKQYAAAMAKVKQQTAKNQIVLTATVIATGIVSASTHNFQALAFINQSTTAKGSKNTQLDQSRVVVTLTRGNGDWKISKLDVF